jgi:hypothetical protein
MKAMQIRLRYNPTGKTIVWRVWREPKVWNTISKSYSACWYWTDESGYTRCGPETWPMFVHYLRGYFESYDATPLQEIS